MRKIATLQKQKILIRKGRKSRKSAQKARADKAFCKRGHAPILRIGKQKSHCKRAKHIDTKRAKCSAVRGEFSDKRIRQSSCHCAQKSPKPDDE